MGSAWFFASSAKAMLSAAAQGASLAFMRGKTAGQPLPAG